MHPNEADQTVRQNDEQATAQRARLLGLNYIDSRQWSAQVGLITDVLSITEMTNLHAIPIHFDTNRLEFAITISTPQTSMKQLRGRFPDYNLSFSIISEAGYKELMLRHDPPQEVHYDDISIKTEGASETLESVSRTLETVRSDDILEYLITQAQALGASDIHFENEKRHVRMRFRVDGTLHAIAQLSKEKYKQLSSSIAVRSNISVNAPEPQTGHLSQEFKSPDGAVSTLNMRIETAPSAHGQDAVIRLFNLNRELMRLDNLGLSDSLRNELQHIVEHPHGMVLVVGPTGSGKTTTLYSLLDQLNTPTRKIVTLEDPVEYDFEGVTQIPVKTRSEDTSFADRLRAVLRLDPDVIMIGEIRDLDTARTALQAALTGHLVLSTFHASNAASALTRMLDVIGQNPLFANAIRLVLAQRLVRQLDDATKQPYEPDERIRSEIHEIINSLPEGVERPNLDQLQLYHPGSSESAPFGYTGRLMIAEQLRLTPEIQSILRRGPNAVSTYEIHELARKQGMVSLMQDGVLKALAGKTAIEEVFRTVD